MEKKKYSINVKIAILIAAWITMASDMVITPILGNIMGAFPNVSPAWSAMAYNIAGFAFIAASLVTPYLCRKFTKRSLMLVCSVIAILTGGFGGIVANINYIIILHLIEGLAAGVCTNLIPSFIVDISSNDDEVVKLNSLNGVFGTVAGFICSSLAGVVATKYGWQSAYYIFFLGFLVFVWMLIFLPKTALEKAEEKSTEKIKVNGRTILWAIEVFIFSWLINIFWTFISTAIEETGVGSADVAGVTLSLVTVTSFVGGFLMIPFSKYLKNFAMHACIVFWVAALVIVLSAQSAALYYVAGLLWGIGQGVAFPYMYAKASLVARKGTETVAICLTTIGWYLGVGVTSILYAPIAAAFHTDSALFALKVELIGFVIYAVLATIRALSERKADRPVG